MSGKYVTGGGLMSIDFQSGKAIFRSADGQSETGDYTINGDTITLKVKSMPGGSANLTIMKDGSLQGGGMTFTKSAS